MILFSVLGVLVILTVLVDAFETIILPRRINRRIRLARIFYRTFWRLWKKGKKLFISDSNTKDYLGFFGPLSLIILITIWAISLIIGFALVNFGAQIDIFSPHNSKDLITYLYLSGGTFFPVGLGDTHPLQVPGKILAITESGVGFAFLAMVIGYLPVLYQAFSRREVNINLLDSHAGSPPSASYLLQQLTIDRGVEELKEQLINWEKWCAELLETHISYPVLAYYRSQHDDQSWVAALLMILDTTTLVLASENHVLHNYAKSTFAIARHAAVDLTEVFKLSPQTPHRDRMLKQDLDTLRILLKDSGFPLKNGLKAEEKLNYLRTLYEPYMQSLANFFLMPIAPFVLDGKVQEAWRKNI